MKAYIKKLSLVFMMVSVIGATLLCADSGGDEIGRYINVTIDEVGDGCVGIFKVGFYTTTTGARIVALPFRAMGAVPRTTATALLTGGTYLGMRYGSGQNPFEQPNRELNATNVATVTIFTLSAGMLAWDWYQGWKKEQPSGNCTCKKI